MNDSPAVVSEILANWVDRRSPQEIEHQNKDQSLHKEDARVATEIALATQAADLDALAHLLPRRDAVALLLQELKKEEGALEAIRAVEREAEERQRREKDAVRNVAEANRRMALTQAQQLNEKWHNFFPLAGNFYGRDQTPVEAWEKAKAEYDKLVSDNNLQDWEIKGLMAGRERGW